VQPPPHQPRRALGQDVREEVLRAVEVDVVDRHHLALRPVLPGVAEHVVDVADRDAHASRRSRASATRCGWSNQYSRSSGSISARITASYQVWSSTSSARASGTK